MENKRIEVQPKRGILGLGLPIMLATGCFFIYGGWKGLDPAYFITGKYRGLFNGTPWWFRGPFLMSVGIMCLSVLPRTAARVFSDGPYIVFDDQGINFRTGLNWKNAKWNDVERVFARRASSQYSSYGMITIIFREEFGRTVFGRNIKISLPTNSAEFDATSLVKLIRTNRPEISGDLERQLQAADFNKKSWLG